MIYTLSKYATAHYRDGKMTGVSISGFSKENGETKYNNIFIPEKDLKIKKNSDGGYTIAFNLLEINKRESKPKT